MIEVLFVHFRYLNRYFFINFCFSINTLNTCSDEKLNGEESVAQQEHRLASLRRNLKKEKTRLKYEKLKAEKEGLIFDDHKENCETFESGEEILNSEKNDCLKANEVDKIERTDEKDINDYKTKLDS